jgi:hypothetical protein
MPGFARLANQLERQLTAAAKQGRGASGQRIYVLHEGDVASARRARCPALYAPLKLRERSPLAVIMVLPGTGGEAVKRKSPTRQRRYRSGGWKESPLRPLTPEGKRRRAQWLRAWSLYMNQLLFAEAERR